MMNFLNNPHEPGPSEGREPAVPWPEAARIGFAALAAALFWFQPALLTRHLHLSGWVAIAIAGYPMLREAALNLRERRMTMELSMTLALACAAAIGEFLTALVITLFVLVAEVLEGLTVGRGRRAIEDLLDVLPRSVTARRDGASVAIQLGDLQRGEVVLVNPGGRLPVDGTVVGGNSFVDESVITGEPMPVEKHTGAWVHAGSINQSGALDVRVERIGRDTAFGRIVTAVEQAEQSRAPIQKLADQLAGYLVYFALACAAGTWLVTRDLRSTISVIIVAGACGIAAGTPLAVLGAIGRAARLGAIVKGGIFLEALGRVDTVVLDKTGTLTFGTPEVVAIEAMAGYSREQVLAWAALAEGRSEHPLGGAILRQAEAEGLSWEEPAQFVSVPGRGVSARGAMGLVLAGNRDHLAANGVQVEGALAQDHPAATEILVALEGALAGRIWIADAARKEARAAVQALRALAIHTVLLTGDGPQAADALGRELGIEAVEAGLLPDQKQARIVQLKRGGRRVAMVGDGVNDAPALVAADIGIAMGSGTDVARETADVVLIGNDLLKLVETVKVARHMRRVVFQNFAGTLAVDGIGVGMAAFGLLNPLLAAFIHVTSELAFILNATRLLPPRAGQLRMGAEEAPVTRVTL